MATDIDIEAIEARLAAATPGEWKAGRMDTESYDGNGYGPYKNVYGGPDGETAARGEGPNCRANAAFIAHAPADIAALLAEVKRLREERGEFRQNDVRAYCRNCRCTQSLHIGCYECTDDRSDGQVCHDFEPMTEEDQALAEEQSE